MAKIAFTKLGLKINTEVKSINWNDQVIEIKKYLPIDAKLNLISNVLNNCAEDEKYYNMGKFEVYFALEVLYAYSNITFTEKQREDVCKLYDLVVSSGLYDIILVEIDKEEIHFLYETAHNAIHAIYAYSNSLMGVLDAVNTDYSDLNLSAEDIQKKLADPENLALLRGIMTKLG